MADERDYAEIFKLADKNNDGILTFDELVTQMKLMGYKGDTEHFKKMFKASHQKNKLRYHEFMESMKSAPPIVHKVALLRRIFTTLDISGTGSLSRNEISKALQKMGQSFNKTDIDNLMNIVDKNHNDKIELEEFIQAFMDFRDSNNKYI